MSSPHLEHQPFFELLVDLFQRLLIFGQPPCQPIRAVDVDLFHELFEELSAEDQHLIVIPWCKLLQDLTVPGMTEERLEVSLNAVRDCLDLPDELLIDQPWVLERSAEFDFGGYNIEPALQEAFDEFQADKGSNIGEDFALEETPRVLSNGIPRETASSSQLTEPLEFRQLPKEDVGVPFEEGLDDDFGASADFGLPIVVLNADRSTSLDPSRLVLQPSSEESTGTHTVPPVTCLSPPAAPQRPWIERHVRPLLAATMIAAFFVGCGAHALTDSEREREPTIRWTLTNNQQIEFVIIQPNSSLGWRGVFDVVNMTEMQDVPQIGFQEFSNGFVIETEEEGSILVRSE